MKKTLSILACSLVLAGCSLAPESKLSGSYQGKPFSLRLPKDAEWKNVKDDVTTNGVHFEAESISTMNNPEVINSTAAGRVTIIDASGKLLGTAVGAAAQTAK
jgi:hypothetical protein